MSLEDWMIDGPDALDDGIIGVVKVLREAGIDTFNSCQGGPEHQSERPTVWFNGDNDEGFRAEDVATAAGFQVYHIARFWYTRGGVRNGPFWEIAFVQGAAHR